MKLLTESLTIGIFGLSVVFSGLVLLILLINVQTWFVGRLQKRKAAASEGSLPSASAPAPHVSAPAAGHEQPSANTQSAVHEQPSANVRSAAHGQTDFRDTSASPLDPSLKLTGVDEKTAAIIMAIVCDETGCRPEELHFKSIRALSR